MEQEREQQNAKEAEDEINANVVKFTLRLGPDAMTTLKWLKEKRKTSSFTDVFRHAIATEKFLFDRQDGGEEIILEDKKTGRQKIFDLR